MDVRVVLWRKLSAEELMLWTVVLDKPPGGPLDCKEIQPVHSKGDQSWVFFGRNDAKAESTLATSCEVLTHWKRPWCWEGLGARGEGDDRGWDGWMASPTQWTWVWVNSGSWWWTGRPGVLWFMGLQRAGHNWVTELNKRTSKINVVSLGKYALDLIMNWNDRKELGINLLARKLTQILS